MILRTADMPTKGVLNPEVSMIDVPPLTFGEMLKYLNDEQLTPFRDYLHALEYIISRDPRIGMVSILDADYILYVFKAISSSKDSKLRITADCQHCHKKHSRLIDLNQVEYQDINEDALNIKEVELGEEKIKFRYPTISEFIKFASSVGRYKENLGIDVIKLASMLDTGSIEESVDLVMNATSEDIAVISYLDDQLFKIITPLEISCPTHPELRGTTAAFTLSAVDIFQDILQFNQVTESKILLRKVRKSSES